MEVEDTFSLPCGQASPVKRRKVFDPRLSQDNGKALDRGRGSTTAAIGRSSPALGRGTDGSPSGAVVDASAGGRSSPSHSSTVNKLGKGSV